MCMYNKTYKLSKKFGGAYDKYEKNEGIAFDDIEIMFNEKNKIMFNEKNKHGVGKYGIIYDGVIKEKNQDVRPVEIEKVISFI